MSLVDTINILTDRHKRSMSVVACWYSYKHYWALVDITSVKAVSILTNKKLTEFMVCNEVNEQVCTGL